MPSRTKDVKTPNFSLQYGNNVNMLTLSNLLLPCSLFCLFYLTCAFFTFFSYTYCAFVLFYILLGFFCIILLSFYSIMVVRFSFSGLLQLMFCLARISFFYAVLSFVRPFSLVPQSNNVRKCLGLSFYTVIVIFVMSFILSISCR